MNNILNYLIPVTDVDKLKHTSLFDKCCTQTLSPDDFDEPANGQFCHISFDDNGINPATITKELDDHNIKHYDEATEADFMVEHNRKDYEKKEPLKGIFIDRDTGEFKILTGRFTDKKSMIKKYGSKTKDYIARKVFEQPIFDWIISNAKNNLDAYLMFSTAYSKWEGTEALGEYYTKLMHDLPQFFDKKRKKISDSVVDELQEDNDETKKNYVKYNAEWQPIDDDGQPLVKGNGIISWSGPDNELEKPYNSPEFFHYFQNIINEYPEYTNIKLYINSDSGVKTYVLSRDDILAGYFSPVDYNLNTSTWRRGGAYQSLLNHGGHDKAVRIKGGIFLIGNRYNERLQKEVPYFIGTYGDMIGNRMHDQNAILLDVVVDKIDENGVLFNGSADNYIKNNPNAYLNSKEILKKCQSRYTSHDGVIMIAVDIDKSNFVYYLTTQQIEDNIHYLDNKDITLQSFGSEAKNLPIKNKMHRWKILARKSEIKSKFDLLNAAEKVMKSDFSINKSAPSSNADKMAIFAKNNPNYTPKN